MMLRIIGILLFVVGLCGLGLGSMMFGDIKISAMIAGAIGVLSGIGFWQIK